MKRTFLLAACLALCTAWPAFSQSILVWDKDHDKLFQDPEGAGLVDETYGIKKALDANGYSYTVVKTLPSDLTPYDIVFVIMGAYC